MNENENAKKTGSSASAKAPSRLVVRRHRQLAQRQVDRPAAEDRQHDGRQTKRDEGKPGDAGKERAPRDLRQRIDRAEFEHLQPAGLQEMLDAPGVHPVVDDRHVGARPDEQPRRGEERGNRRQRQQVVRVLRWKACDGSTSRWAVTEYKVALALPGTPLRGPCYGFPTPRRHPARPRTFLAAEGGYTRFMARRGFAIIFTLLGVAFVVSIAGFALLYPARPRAVGPGQLDPRAARRRRSRRGRAGRRRRLPARRANADGPLDRRQPAQGQGRRARPRRAAEADRLRLAVLGQGAGDSRRGDRLQEVGQAGLRLSRVRRRSRVLPGDRGRQGLPDAVEPARSDRRRHLRAVPARHARQDRRVSRSASHRRVQDRGEHVHGEGLHAGAPGDGRVAEPRSLRADRARHRRRPEEERSRRPHADRRGSVPAGGRAARRPGRRVAYEDQVDEKLRSGATRERTSTATTTRASAPRRSA